MSIIAKIVRRFNHKIVRPLVYDESLQYAYSTTSICGGILRGKTAVVTGASSGIGYAISQRLLNEGCNVILTGRNEYKLQASVAKLYNLSLPRITYRVIDQLDTHMIRAGIEEIFNAGNVDIWINCAGVLKQSDRQRQFRGVDSATYFEVVNTNLKSVIFTTDLVANKMMHQDVDGVILNVASLCGFTNGFGYTPYGISKNGVIEYTKRVADQFKEKISIFSVAPGAVATRMGEVGFGKNIAGGSSFTRHVGIPEEIAAEIVFLVGIAAKHLKGRTVLASAGEVL